MKIAFACILATAVLIIGGCSSGQSYIRAGFDFHSLDKIAVIAVEGDLNGEAAKNQIADFFTMELLKKGYAPIERAQVQALLKEQQFQASGVTASEDIARAGKILNVPTVFVINIPSFKEEISMTAKMINVEDGSILWMGSGSGTTGKTLSTIFGAAAGVAGGVAVSGEHDKVLGGVAGGVLGGVAGRALSPQAADKAQEIIKKMCKSLPSRLARKK